MRTQNEIIEKRPTTIGELLKRLNELPSDMAFDSFVLNAKDKRGEIFKIEYRCY
jgi:hypothetical protein